MPIDIRATVTCSLGTLISGSINDDYVQGTGLIKTRGSCEISGIVTPAIGTAVTFSYTKGGSTTQIPRKLRVLSSFADPFRRTTRVELGCKLTYLSDLREAIDWTAFDDTANEDYTADDAKIITLPISAASVMGKCLAALGITASSSPLTNKFSIAAFDLSAGYVNVLSDLLVSESYCGYLNASEVLQVFSLDQPGGAGPVLDKSRIIDISSIGVGQLPGEAVTVSYSTLKLQKPDAVAGNTSSGVRPGWDQSTTSNIFEVRFPYSSAGTPAVASYRIEETTTTTTNYITIKVGDETKRVVGSRVTNLVTGAPAIAGSLITDYLNNGIPFNGSPAVYKNTYETYGYDAAGNQTFYSRYVEGSAWYVIGSLPLPFVFSSTDYVSVFWGGIVAIEREVQRGLVAGDFQNVTTEQYGSWFQTINGQQTMAAARSAFTTSSQVSNFINSAFPVQLTLLDTRVTIGRRTEAQTSPDEQQIINASNAKDGDPNNGWRTSSTSELELALGSATAQRRIELSLPYAPDDVFTGPSGGPFGSQASDAPQKAKRFGVVQNRLLLGNRSGMNIQCAPEHLPAAPFSAFVVTANGLSGLYRTNGTSWTMSSEGVIVSTDALFWGAVGTSEGATGDFWFPVAPGITQLPYTPPAVDGVVTVPGTVPLWNETALILGRTRHACSITGLGYALQQTTPLALVTKTRASVERSAVVAVPAASLTLTALEPTVVADSSVLLAVPAADISLAALAPTVPLDAVVQVPAAGLALAAVAPDAVGSPTSWTPSAISTSLWLDASDAGTITTVSGAVSQWNDKSGNSRNATQSTSGSRPTVSAAAQNSLDALSFDGSNDFMSLASALAAASSGSFDVYFIGKPDTTSRNSTYTGGGIVRRHAANDAAGNWSTGIRSTGAAVVGHHLTSGDNANGIVFGGSITSNANTLISWSYNASGGSTSAQQWTIRINAGSPVTESTGATSTAWGTGNGEIGRGYAGVGYYYKGLVYEIIICASEPGTSDRQKVEGYLAHKWGMTANLPSDHPYKTTAPLA